MQRWFTAGLANTAPWIPTAAATGTVLALYVVPGHESDRARQIAVLWGIGFALVVGVLLGVVAALRSTPSRANSRAHAQILERIRGLNARLDSLKAANGAPSPWLAEAMAHVCFIEERLGWTNGRPPEREEVDPTWSSAAAYQDLWTAIHRAEEALIAFASPAQLEAGVAHDMLRIIGSPLEKSLKQELEKIQEDLKRSHTDPESVTARLREIRRAVNEFRDGRWDGLVNARKRLVRSAVMTAWTAYGILILALALDAPRDSVAAGSLFFLVGALVGLMAQLRSDARRNDVIEDYGLAAARLYQIVLVSGLAGVAGVILTPIASTIGGAVAEASKADLSKVFNVADNPGQLFVAAVFGLSPQLIIDRLSTSAEQYKAQLSSTQVAAPEAPSGDTAASDT